MSDLTKEQICDYILKAQSHDAEAMQALIDCNIKLIQKCIRINLSVYLGTALFSSLDTDDIIQEAILAFITAVTKYDVTGIAALSTYAHNWIDGAVKNQIKFQLNRAGITGIKYNKNAFSHCDENGIDEDIPSAEDDMQDRLIEREEHEEAHRRLQKALWKLSDDERKTLFMAYGIGDKEILNSRKIAKSLGCSEFTVIKIVEDAKKKLTEAYKKN